MAAVAPLDGLVPLLSAVDTTQLLPTLASVLAEAVDAREVRVQLADYRMTTLRTLGAVRPGAGRNRTPRTDRVDDSAAGRVFREQRTTVEPGHDGDVVRAPVSLRGQRLGVLTVVLPPDALDRDDAVAAVRAAATAVAYVLRVAGEGSDVFEVARRAGRLSLAAELQWQLLPGTGLAGAGFELSGHLEPALQVGGDAYDWAHDGRVVWLAVVHADGAATSSALACSLAVTALRNARRAEVALPRQVELASAAVWAQFRGDHLVAALLLRLDQVTGRVDVVRAGAGHLFRVHDGAATAVAVSSQPSLGVDGELTYTASRLAVRSGDRLLLCTHGAISATDPQGQRFGLGAVEEFLERHRDLSTAEVVRRLVRRLLEHSQDDLSEDASVVCLDWHPERPR